MSRGSWKGVLAPEGGSPRLGEDSSGAPCSASFHPLATWNARRRSGVGLSSFSSLRFHSMRSELGSASPQIQSGASFLKVVSTHPEHPEDV